jgi:hypothetical protein
MPRGPIPIPSSSTQSVSDLVRMSGAITGSSGRWARLSPEMAVSEGRRVEGLLTRTEAEWAAASPDDGPPLGELQRAYEGLDTMRRRLREEDEGGHPHFGRATGGEPVGTPSVRRLAAEQLEVDLARVTAQWAVRGWGDPSQGGAGGEGAALTQGGSRKRTRTRSGAEWEEEVELFCLCLQPYQEGELMVSCDDCTNWFHPVCVGISDHAAEELDFYQCPPCKGVPVATPPPPAIVTVVSRPRRGVVPDMGGMAPSPTPSRTASTPMYRGWATTRGMTRPIVTPLLPPHPVESPDVALLQDETQILKWQAVPVAREDGEAGPVLPLGVREAWFQGVSRFYYSWQAKMVDDTVRFEGGFLTADKARLAREACLASVVRVPLSRASSHLEIVGVPGSSGYEASSEVVEVVSGPRAYGNDRNARRRAQTCADVETWLRCWGLMLVRTDAPANTAIRGGPHPLPTARPHKPVSCM